MPDFAICSYTPTISELIEKSRRSPAPSTSVLLISQPKTPNLPDLPKTREEVEAVTLKMHQEKIVALNLDGPSATVARVKKEIVSFSWIHLACHAVQNSARPLQSCFYLESGRFELLEIMRQHVPDGEVAFLSACQTSAGTEQLSEEAVHLAAGMLAAGYRGVVATMWAIKDKYGPEVAISFYEYLLNRTRNCDEDGKRLDGADAAYALDDAVQALRRRIGDMEDGLMAWIPYVHFGV